MIIYVLDFSFHLINLYNKLRLIHTFKKSIKKSYFYYKSNKVVLYDTSMNKMYI